MLWETDEVARFMGGGVVFTRGDFGKEMYVIRSGRVRISRASDGHDVVLAMLGPGDFFGEMALFGTRPRCATATCSVDTTLTRVDEHAFKSAMGDAIVWDMLSRMSRRIREVDESFEQLSVKDDKIRGHLASMSVRSKWFD